MVKFTGSFVLLLLLLNPVEAQAQWVNGIRGPAAADSEPSPQDPDSMPLSGSRLGPGAVLIDFDAAPAPAAFLDAVALTTEYVDLGVSFVGPGSTNGGSVLNELGNFGVSGYSPPNFLAFNILGTNSDGGIPSGPETLIFDPFIEAIELLAGSQSPGEATLTCFDPSDAMVGTETITMNSTLQVLGITGPEIRRCVLSFTAESAVFDNLSFLPLPGTGPVPEEIPTLSTGALFGLVGLLAFLGAGLLRLRARRV